MFIRDSEKKSTYNFAIQKKNSKKLTSGKDISGRSKSRKPTFNPQLPLPNPLESSKIY